MPRISIVKGENRKENIASAIKLIENDIEKAIKSKKLKQLFIKINAIDSSFPLACTHADALEIVLNIFHDKFDEIVVGDNTFVFGKYKGGPYRKMLERFPKVRFSDLTDFETANINFKKLNGNVIGKISLLPKTAFTISLALPKTHDAFVYTGCLKNMLGCVIDNRPSVHALNPYDRLWLNRYVKSNKFKWGNLVSVIEKTKPDLCILDGYEGMEGTGPLFGKGIKLGIAMCSLDGITLDKLAAKICGINYVPYLSLLSHDSEDIEIIREGFKNMSEIEKEFKLHPNTKYQIMSEELLIPRPDTRLIISLLRRPYRIKDKIMEKLKRI